MKDNVMDKFSGNLAKITVFLLQAHAAFVMTSGQQSALSVKSFQAISAVEALRDELAGQIFEAVLKEETNNDEKTGCSKWQ